MLVKPFAKPLVDDLLHVALNVAVELALGLSFKLRLRQTHADHRDQSFANVIAGDAHFIFLLLEHAGIGSKIVDRACQRGAKARKVRPAVHGVDRVGKCKDVFAVAVVVLQRDFDFQLPRLPSM